MPLRITRRLGASLAVLLLLITLGYSSLTITASTKGSASPQAQTVTILIVGAQQPPGFQPSIVTIHAGDILVFINQSTPPATYTIMANDNSFHSPPIAPGAQWSTTISAVGDVAFDDPAYASSMLGAAHVVSAETPLFPTPNPILEATTVAGIAAPGVTHLTPQAKQQLPSSSPPWGFIATIGVLVMLALLVGGGAVIMRQRVGKR